jgi:HrpA-like RNA helicase
MVVKKVKSNNDKTKVKKEKNSNKNNSSVKKSNKKNNTSSRKTSSTRASTRASTRKSNKSNNGKSKTSRKSKVASSRKSNNGKSKVASSRKSNNGKSKVASSRKSEKNNIMAHTVQQAEVEALNNADFKKALKKPIGINDPDGENINPLTRQPYMNFYKDDVVEVKGEKIPATYKNISEKWRHLLINTDTKEDILTSIKKNQVTLARAGTGVGKTVMIPKIALHAFDYGEKVICTIPKRKPTRIAAQWAAKCLDVKLGEEVGYFFGGESKVSDKTRLVFATPGSVISKLTQKDPTLSEYKVIIIDEAHERTIQTDLILMYLKKAVQMRDDLKVVIMSATINLKLFRDYFPTSLNSYPKNSIKNNNIPTPIFNFGEVNAGETTPHPIIDKWEDKPLKPHEWMIKAVEIIIKIMKETDKGDILVFIKAGGDGKKMCDDLKNKTKALGLNPFCTVLEGKSSNEDADYATDPLKYKEHELCNPIPCDRKVVMSTNVAESSVTVEGIEFVIDSGLHFEESYEPETMARSLTEEWIAQSSARQRKGRAGRTKPGTCYHMYTEAQHDTFSEFPIPDVKKSDLSSDILDMFSLKTIKNVGDVRKLIAEMIEPPTEKFINSALMILSGLGAITSHDPEGTRTDLGTAMGEFRSLKPSMAKAILASYYYKCSREITALVAMLVHADGRMVSIINQFRPSKRAKGKPDLERAEEMFYKNELKKFKDPSGDMLTLLNIYDAYRKYKMELKTKNNALKLEIVDVVNNTVEGMVAGAKKRNARNNVKSDKNGNIKLVDVVKTLKKNPKLQKMIKKQQEVAKSVGGRSEDASNVLNEIKEDKEGYGSSKNLLKQWCIKRGINPKKMEKVEQSAGDYFRQLKQAISGRQRGGGDDNSEDNKKKNNSDDKKDADGEVFKGRPDELVLFENLTHFQDMKERILRTMLTGYIINTAKLAMSNKNLFKTCYPPKKIMAQPDRDSMLEGTHTIVMYDELFQLRKGSDTLKLNIVSDIPRSIRDDLNTADKNIIDKCDIDIIKGNNKGDRDNKGDNKHSGNKNKSNKNKNRNRSNKSNKSNKVNDKYKRWGKQNSNKKDNGNKSTNSNSNSNGNNKVKTKRLKGVRQT